MAPYTSSYNNIDEYIAGFPGDVQDILQKIRSTIHEAAPEAVEAISYQVPTFKLKGNLVHFAAWKTHIRILSNAIRHYALRSRAIFIREIKRHGAFSAEPADSV